jgi:glycosyltransferase involved in cell wall biosynthesis
MNRSAVFVLSSAWEGFGVVLVEALALGLPVVSTNCTYGPSEILCNGKYGALVSVGDHEMMAQSLLNALNNPVQKCASHLEQFTIRAVACEYLSLIGS